MHLVIDRTVGTTVDLLLFEQVAASSMMSFATMSSFSHFLTSIKHFFFLKEFHVIIIIVLVLFLIERPESACSILEESYDYFLDL